MVANPARVRHGRVDDGMLLSVKVEYQLTPAELWEAQWTLMRSTGLGLKKMLPIFIIGAVVIVVYLVVANPPRSQAPPPPPPMEQNLAREILLPLVPWVLIAGVVIWSLRHAIKRAGSSDRLKRMQMLSADDEQVNISDGVSHTMHDWRAFVEFRETRNLFLLFLDVNMAIPVPKRALVGAALEKFRAMLQRNVGKRGGAQQPPLSRTGVEPLEGREHI
jgi:hypothetical protein